MLPDQTRQMLSHIRSTSNELLSNPLEPLHVTRFARIQGTVATYYWRIVQTMRMWRRKRWQRVGWWFWIVHILTHHIGCRRWLSRWAREVWVTLCIIWRLCVPGICNIFGKPIFKCFPADDCRFLMCGPQHLLMKNSEIWPTSLKSWICQWR